MYIDKELGNCLQQQSVFIFRKRIIYSDNSLVYSIVNSVIPVFSKIWAWWGDILNT